MASSASVCWMRETRSRTNAGPRRFIGGAASSAKRTAASWRTLIVSRSIGISLGLPIDELLAAVDVEGRAGNCGVGHEVDGQCGDVSRADHAPDRQRRAKLLAARVQPVTEDRCRERRVNESGG